MGCLFFSPRTLQQDFYTISVKRNVVGKYRYGQDTYDFDEGLMTFFSPSQVISVELI